MRAFGNYLLLVALLVIAGCNSSQNPTTSAVTTAPAVNKVTGVVTYRQQAQLSPNARLELRLVNVSQASTVVAQKTINPAGQVPIMFELDFDPTQINPAHIYVVQAVILDGERRYTHTLQYPALTKGASAKLEIIVTPETTASEKLKAEHVKLENLIGGMKRVTGQQETPEVMIGWDAFFEDKELRWVRENADQGDKGRVNSQYSYYKSGQPMMIVREEKKDATSPLIIARVGWSEAGDTVFQEKTGGQTAEVTEGETKALLDAAKKAQTAALAANAKKKK